MDVIITLDMSQHTVIIQDKEGLEEHILLFVTSKFVSSHILSICFKGNYPRPRNLVNLPLVNQSSLVAITHLRDTVLAALCLTVKDLLSLASDHFSLQHLLRFADLIKLNILR